MANKSNQYQPGRKAGSVLGRSSQSNEFDDAVTTDILDDLTEAFDEHQTGDPGDLFITDVSLREYVKPESDEVLPPGFLLTDRFEIIELVHAAGMSHVYKAIDQLRCSEDSDDIYVAIKIMRPSIASDDRARLTLEREAAVAQSLSHSNIVNIFDFVDHDGQYFLVMEWLDGESVNAMLRRTSGEGVEAGLARTVITLAATAVQHAHRNDVVHADINPSNIFITDTQEIKLLDFGVAKAARASEQSEEGRFGFVTQTYASPEVLSGMPPVFEDDVFSLACVVYRLLSGKHPFGGTLSLVARHKGLTVEPVAGLPAREWETLRRALSYERSDRPEGVGEFVSWGAGVAGEDQSAVHPARRLMPPHWMWLAATAAVVILAGGTWLYQRGTVDETTSRVEPALPEDTTAAEPAISASEALVIAATQRLRDGQLIEPAEVNARALFRAALVLDSDNAGALRGLRTISDNFVQEAHEALGEEDPIAAYAALTVANETDAANPAIGIVDQLLTAKGNGELSDARLAVTTGDLDVAVQKLSRAEQYQHIDPVAVQELRRQIDERQRSDLLLARLAAANALIEADRLLLPEGENAYALILGLQGQFGEDVRLVAAKERLGERLLTRAAFAAAATDVAQAHELLGAVDALGVLTPEVEAVRSSLTAVDDATEIVEVPEPQVADEQVDNAVETMEAPEPQVADEQSGDAIDWGDVQTPQFIEEQVDDTSLQSSESTPPVPEEASPEPATTPADSEIRRLSLQDLGIKEYTAPRFPLRAVRRNLSGMVEVRFVINAAGTTESIEVLHSEPGNVFSQSAVNAIDQWRFEARQESTHAQVTLRFDQEE